MTRQNVNEACLAGHHTVAERRGGLQKVVVTPEESGIAQAARTVAKEIGHRGVGEHPRRNLLKRPKRRKRAQPPGQGKRVHSSALGEVRSGKRASVEMVGHPAPNE